MSTNFKFDGEVGSYLGVAIASWFITAITIGIASPWVICMRQRWIIEHTLIEERRCKFNGEGAELFGEFIVWWLLCIVTLGAYSFWVGPRLRKWIVENSQI